MTAQEIVDQLDFERKFRDLTPDGKLEFIGREVFTQGKKYSELPCVKNDCPKGMTRREKLTFGGVCAMIAALVVGMIQILQAIAAGAR